MRFGVIIFAVILVEGCATTPSNMMVLKYHDFGPQAVAHETIGSDSQGACNRLIINGA